MNRTCPPLVATADPTLRDELVRLAAAAGVAPEVAGDPLAALRSWPRAAVVLVGGDLAAAIGSLAPERRDGVQVVTWGAPPPELFRVALAVGAEEVAELPRSEASIVEALTDLGEAGRGRALVVGVMGGSGGAGATTLACALAQSGSRGGDAVVIDCDPLGPGLDRVLGLDRERGSRWDALCQTTGRLGARALREALPRRDRLGVLTWQAGSTDALQGLAVREVISAARRGHDLVVVDLPRTPHGLAEEVVARCDVLLVVVVPSVPGVASAARLCTRLDAHATPRLVLRGDGLGRTAVEGATGRTVVAELPHQRGVAESVDLGYGPLRSRRVPLGRACTDLLATITGQAGLAGRERVAA